MIAQLGRPDASWAEGSFELDVSTSRQRALEGARIWEGSKLDGSSVVLGRRKDRRHDGGRDGRFESG